MGCLRLLQEAGGWNGGLKGIYDICHDFIYPGIHNVLRFLDNHDTDRFLKEYPRVRPTCQAGSRALLSAHHAGTNHTGPAAHAWQQSRATLIST